MAVFVLQLLFSSICMGLTVVGIDKQGVSHAPYTTQGQNY